MVLNKNRFGLLLKELRENNNLTQDVVAKGLSITRSAYSHYETGKTEPSMDNILRIAQIFNVSPEYLLTEESTEFYLNDSSSKFDFQNKKTPASMTELREEERNLIVLFRLANAREKRKILRELEKSNDNKNDKKPTDT